MQAVLRLATLEVPFREDFSEILVSVSLELIGIRVWVGLGWAWQFMIKSKLYFMLNYIQKEWVTLNLLTYFLSEEYPETIIGRWHLFHIEGICCQNMASCSPPLSGNNEEENWKYLNNRIYCTWMQVEHSWKATNFSR